MIDIVQAERRLNFQLLLIHNEFVLVFGIIQSYRRLEPPLFQETKSEFQFRLHSLSKFVLQYALMFAGHI